MTVRSGQDWDQSSRRQEPKVGAFWQPQAVYIDRVRLLETLHSREFAAGMAEVIKYGLLGDDLLFQELELLDFIRPDSAELIPIIRRCCEIKAQIVIAWMKKNRQKKMDVCYST